MVPEVVNARQIGRDVEQLAIMLTQGKSKSPIPSHRLLRLLYLCGKDLVLMLPLVPGFQFASLLRDVLSKARRNKLLPPASRPASPSRTQHPQAPALPTWSDSALGSGGSGLGNGTGTGTGTGSSSTAPPSLSQSLETGQEFSNGFTFDQPGPGETFPGAPLDFSYAEHLLGHTTTASSGKNGHMNGAETPMNGLVSHHLQSFLLHYSL